MSVDSSGEDFAEGLQEYLDRARRANSEAALGHHFLTFVQDTFSTLDCDQAHRVLPFLEEFVQIEEATVAFQGRIDARLGNVIIEFKTDLDRYLDDAKDQLRDYITAVWNEQGQDQKYYLVASDGTTSIVYLAEIPEGESLTPENVVLNEVDTIDLAGGDPDTVFTKLDQYLLFSDDILPTADNIVTDFGPDAPVCREGMDILREEWDEIGEDGVEVLFDEWQRYLEIVHGESDHSEELFLRHTYLSVLAKLMAYVQYSGGTLPDEDEISDVITGETFARWGIKNFIEEDFFSWISRSQAEGVDKRITQHVLARLRDYDLSAIEEDVLKALYQDLVTAGERHNLGEYYTPDWLVEEIVRDELEDDPEASVLDPTCGSGTFLFQAIRYKREQTDLDDEELLDHIFENVAGIDIHPLAVIVARVNYLLALGDLVRDARSGSVSIPVYLSNSIMPPSYEMSQETVHVYRFQADETVFEVPVSVTEDGEVLNDLLDSVKSYLDSNDTISADSFHAYAERQVGDEYADLSDDERNVIYRRIVQRIKELQDEGRDTIWTFILKNVYKPIYFEDQKFDRVLGNPPWLSYRYISREEYEDHVRNLIVNEYGLLDSGNVENITHMELAALFFVYSIDHYLDDDEGRISFVLPRGVFNGDHLRNLRGVEFDASAHLTGLWDLKEVRPLFNMLTCVLSGAKGEGDSYPLEGRRYSGTLPEVNVTREEARDALEIEDTTYYLNILGDRSVVMDRELDPQVFDATSPYEEEIRQGATVVPRSLWFVDFQQHETFGVHAQEPLVETSERARTRAKEPWDTVEMNGQIERDFLYYCVTGSELVHFAHLDFPVSVLPLQISGRDFHMLDEDTARSNGYQHLTDWISSASEQWEAKKEETTDEGLLEWLNYRHKLTQQDPNPRYLVLQNTSGSYVYGTVVDTEELDDISVDGTRIELQRNNDGRIPLTVDHKCYYYETDDRGEAYYLSGFLNAPLVLELIQEMMSQGLFGGRDVHKRVWEIAIPEYDPDNPTHTAIRDAAIEGEERAYEMLPDLLDQYDPLTSVGWIRRRQREELEPLQSELSELCLEALEAKNPKQSSLFDSIEE
jgi:hypothetical protein